MTDEGGRARAHVVATSAADDAAYESLVDLSTLLAGHEMPELSSPASAPA